MHTLYLHITPVYEPVTLFDRPSSRHTSEMQHTLSRQHIAKTIDALVKMRRYIINTYIINGPNPTPIPVSGTCAVVHNETKSAVVIN